MVVYIVSFISILILIVIFVLSKVLYKEPKSEYYFNNVKHYNVIHQKDIMSSPKFVLEFSILLRNFYADYIFLYVE